MVRYGREGIGLQNMLSVVECGALSFGMRGLLLYFKFSIYEFV